MQVYNKLVMDRFMSRHDLVFNEIPHIWYEAPFLGNGFMGTTLCFSEDNKQLFINLGHTCVYDNRPIYGSQDDQMYLTPRLPVGKIAISFDGTVTGVDLRLDIYNARVFGEISTTSGKVEINCMIFNDTDCMVMEHKESAWEKISVSYIPSVAESPRYNFGVIDDETAYKKYGRARPSRMFTHNNMNAYLQPYYCGGGYCVSFTDVDGKFFVGINQGSDLKAVAPDGLRLLKNAIVNCESLTDNHKKWWNNYFAKSFISIDSGVYESFVYIQLYKLACASRENGRPFDTCGPWLSEITRWPGGWWNLNVELTISPLYVTNHIDIAHCVNNALRNNTQQLIDNVPEKYRVDCAALGRYTTSSLYAPVTEPGNLDAPNREREAGNLIWTLFYIWQEYRITGDDELIRNIVYPLLKRAVKFYSYFLEADLLGKFHLKATLSPEYEKSDSEDVNYDLSLLRWGCRTLLEITKILGVDDSDSDMWARILRNLVDYPQSDAEGMFIAGKTPYATSHRHYSHLLAFYPLHVLNENNPKERELVEKSILYWQSKKEALLGYSQSGAASMYAMLHNGNKALTHLENLWKGFIQPNTMYHEDGNPVIETPPSAATAIVEMLIQSHNGYIDFFPAVPDAWKNICFDGLLCYDGFEVGARLTDGKLEWLTIKSNLGKPCRFKATFAKYPEFSNVTFTRTNFGIYDVELEKGETAIISTVPSPIIDCVSVPNSTVNCYGLNEKNRVISGKA